MMAVCEKGHARNGFSGFTGLEHFIMIAVIHVAEIAT